MVATTYVKKDFQYQNCLSGIKENKMTDLNKKRLLLLASGSADHKRHYSQYCVLMREDLVRWCIGHASLTTKGEEELKRLEKHDDLL